MPNPPRSRQDLSHTIKMTCDFGALIPNLLLEVVPGDAMKCRTDIFMRMQPMIFPVMHEVDVYQHYFYVPWYMIWDNFEKFIVPQDGEGSGEGETPIPMPPYFSPTQAVNSGGKTLLFQKGTLWDYMGLPPISAYTDFPASATDDTRIQLAPFIAYQLIYNSYYRDQSLVAETDLSYWKTHDGQNVFNGNTTNDNRLAQLFTLRYRAWEKDLFTSSLPTPQKGPTQGINLALGDGAVDVVLKEAALQSAIYQRIVHSDGTVDSGNFFGSGTFDNTATGTSRADDNFQPLTNAWLDPHGTFEAQLSDLSGSFSIEELRVAYRAQLYGEMLARGGSRLTEMIRSQFGVVPDDLTMSRPRYLGGGKQNIVISEVLQQSQTSDDSALGEFAGHGISVGSDNRFKAFFSHYGFVIGIMSVRPRTAYGQGVQKLFTKFDRYDYATPVFSHLGEQQVSNGELYFSYTDGKNNQEFGYQPRYYDYRFIASRLAGEMRDTMADFHLNRLFSSRPKLNKDFIEISPSDTNHIFAVTDEGGQHLITEVYHNIRAVRPVPKYGNPTL